MTVRAFDYRCCEIHGPDTLHHLSRCTSCHPRAEATPPPPPVFRRRKQPTKARLSSKKLGRPRSVTLTAREREIAGLAATGMTQKAIGERLQITRAGVESTLGRAMDRIGAKALYELLRFVRAGA